jgi:DNA primase
MISSDVLQRLKRVPIIDYLNQKGFQPVKTVGAEILYYSPVNEESTPSFFVNPSKNVFHDYSGVGEQGDIIRLIQYINGCSFMQAIDLLKAFKPEALSSFSFRGTTSQERLSSIEITSIQSLRNRSLLAYVASRKISQRIAIEYLREIHYQVKDKSYYAVGFGNNKGGYELRSQYFKGCTSPKWFTLLQDQETNVVNVFEGVFDFLSCCEWLRVVKLKNPTIILNSLSFIKDALPMIQECANVNAFLDNDKAGKQGIERIKEAGVNVRDCSHYYQGSKDFNEYLTSNRHKGPIEA